MQIPRFFTCMVLFALAAGVVLAADISGTWSGSMNMGGNDMTLTYTFKVDGEKLTGTVTGPQGEPLTLNEGKINGDKLSFSINVQSPNGDMKITNEGTIKGEEIILTTKMGADFPDFPPMTLKKTK
jgi:hypothetical protein